MRKWWDPLTILGKFCDVKKWVGQPNKETVKNLVGRREYQVENLKPEVVRKLSKQINCKLACSPNRRLKNHNTENNKTKQVQTSNKTTTQVINSKHNPGRYRILRLSLNKNETKDLTWQSFNS